MENNKKPSPCTLVIFGATGDLARRKLLPALYRLQSLDMLPECFNIVGFATRKLTDSEYREYAADAINEFSAYGPVDKKILEKLIENTWFVSSSFDDPGGYTQLSAKFAHISEKRCRKSDTLFYMATPPSFFEGIVEQLHKAGMTRKGVEGDALPKVVIEKPFGRDLESAIKLNEFILSHFDEEQVYRIDHYLGKETVQNILFFRFANGIYEPIWNRRYIDHVQLTVSESVGIGNRGKYFEEAGILRDMVQNHILQLLALFAMEPPINMDADVVRNKKTELLQSLRPIEPHEVLRYVVKGQYGSTVIDSKEIPAYTQEANVLPKSITETFVSMKVMIDNWRWSGVPFYLRTGKRLNKRLTEIAIFFKEVPHCLFSRTITGCPDSNVLVLKIQPDEGISFQFNVKRPGSSSYIETVNMDFSYKESFQAELPEAYERLIYDCMMGDSTLFPHRRAIEASWEFITRILKGWESIATVPFLYSPGTWGPKEADELIARDGRRWRNG